jgi:hypothetical protein
MAGEVRSFFRFAETRGWCCQGLAVCIRGPRLFAQAALPTGPSTAEVQRLLAMTESDRPVDIRDRAILLLLVIYGLRTGEVNRLPGQVDSFLGKARPVTLTWHDKFRRLRSFFHYAIGRGYLAAAPFPTVICNPWFALGQYGASMGANDMSLKSNSNFLSTSP